MTLVPPSSRGSGGSGGATVIQTLGPASGSPANFDFTAIPGTFQTLVIWGQLKDSTVSGFTLVRFNGDSGTNYDFATLTQGAASVTGANGAAASSIQVPNPGTAVVASNPGVFELVIPAYAGTTFRKVCFVRSGYDLGPPVQNVYMTGEWINTAAITQVTLVPNGGSWQNGSIATLYGF